MPVRGYDRLAGSSGVGMESLATFLNFCQPGYMTQRDKDSGLTTRATAAGIY